MINKRRQPAPYFRQQPPFNAISGQFAKLGVGTDLTRVAMMQVIEADTHDNYVVCRGFDPEANTFLNTVNVSKPYPLRGQTGIYTVGEMYPAVKPKTRLGDTPGVAATSAGHPADLDEVIEIMTDDSGNPVAWLLLDNQSTTPTPLRCTTPSIVRQSGDTATGNYIAKNYDVTFRFANSSILGDLEAAGVENLYDTAGTYDTPCLKILTGGTWRIGLLMAASMYGGGMDTTFTVPVSNIIDVAHIPAIIASIQTWATYDGISYRGSVGCDRRFTTLTLLDSLGSIDTLGGYAVNYETTTFAPDTLIKLKGTTTFWDGIGSAGTKVSVTCKLLLEYVSSDDPSSYNWPH